MTFFFLLLLTACRSVAVVRGLELAGALSGSDFFLLRDEGWDRPAEDEGAPLAWGRTEGDEDGAGVLLKKPKRVVCFLSTEDPAALGGMARYEEYGRKKDGKVWSEGREEQRGRAREAHLATRPGPSLRPYPSDSSLFRSSLNPASTRQDRLQSAPNQHIKIER